MVVKSMATIFCNLSQSIYSIPHTPDLPPVPTAVYSNWICIKIQTEIKII